MTRFSSWPRWAVDALRAVLVRVPVLDNTLFELDVECAKRDTVWLEDDETVPGYPVVPPGGQH